MMRKPLLIVVCLLSMLCASMPLWAMETLRLATTTSTENSGLLYELLPDFEKTHDCKVDVIAVGTGKAIKLAEAGDVDVILVHAREREDQFVADGFGIDRRDVMYNDFVLLGPQSDPAGIRNMSDVAEAISQVARTGSSFFSRGDDSGTHTREKQLWKASGTNPLGSWYHETGRGMGEVLIMAGEKQGYTLMDRGTYLSFKFKNQDLDVLVEQDPRLFNPYGIIMVNPARHPHVNADLALQLLDYMTSDPVRLKIKHYKVNGQQLFYVEE